MNRSSFFIQIQVLRTYIPSLDRWLRSVPRASAQKSKGMMARSMIAKWRGGNVEADDMICTEVE